MNVERNAPDAPDVPDAPDAPDAAVDPVPVPDAAPEPAESAAAVDPAPAARLPQYGEYAPELAATSSANDTVTAVQRPQAASAARAGVPHNLGVGSPSAASAAGAGDPAPNGGIKRSAAAAQQQKPGGAYVAPQTEVAAQHQQAGAGKPQRGVDRVLTIVLLAFGALGALYSALTLFSVKSSFQLLSELAEMGDLRVSRGAELSCQILALAILAFYGVVLVFSLRRLRAAKLTFWAPLVAGVIVALVVMVTITAVLMNMPDFTEAMSDPEKALQILRSLQELQADAVNN